MAEEKLSRVNEKREQVEKEVGNQLPCLIPMCESILTCCSYVLNVSGAALLQSPNVRNTDATCTLVATSWYKQHASPHLLVPVSVSAVLQRSLWVVIRRQEPHHCDNRG